MEINVHGGNTMILGHKNHKKSQITPYNLLDDTIYEITYDGEVIWEWVLADHF